jgi:hypothetical protein
MTNRLEAGDGHRAAIGDHLRQAVFGVPIDHPRSEAA